MDAEGTKKSVLGPRESSKFIANNSTEITVNKLVVREVGKLVSAFLQPFGLHLRVENR